MARRFAAPDGPVVARLRRTLDAAPDLVAALEALPAPDLHALMLHLARVRAAGRRPADLLAERPRLDLLEPAPVALELLLEVEGAALRAAGGFKPVELSPIAPAATNAVLGGLDQNLTLATARGSEVLADPTTSLALEAALERRRGSRRRRCAHARGCCGCSASAAAGASTSACSRSPAAAAQRPATALRCAPCSPT